MISKIGMVASAVLLSGVIMVPSALAQNVPFDAGGGGKTVYSPWKLVNKGIGIGFLSNYKCTRTVYYPSGSKKTQTKRPAIVWSWSKAYKC